jgi:holo-[acyl-carrier protein] synthase
MRYNPLVIVGVGIDLVELDRFRAAMRRHGDRLLERLFTKAERGYCAGRWNPAAHYTARFAAKEAVLKALGVGWSGGIRWTDVEVVRSGAGRVEVRLRRRAKRAAASRKVRAVHVNITHSRRYAAAVAVAEG